MTITNIILKATNQTTTPVTIWAIIATIASVISALSAFFSRGHAKKSYELALQNFNDKKSNFGLYLIDCYRWLGKDNATKKILLFHITINNKSEGKSSYKAELEIEYIRSDQSVARVIIPHDEYLLTFIPQKDITTFPNNIRMEEKGILTKWLIFEQPNSISSEYKIEKYSVKISDTLGNTQIADNFIIKDLNHGKAENKN
jgi:hypothetical protein